MKENENKMDRMNTWNESPKLKKEKPNITSIKYLLWDIDGTLLDFDLAEDTAIHTCFHDFKLGDCSDELLESYKLINKKYWQRLEKGEISKKEVLEGRFREFFSTHDLDSSIASEFNQAYQICLGNIACFNTHAKETIQELKSKFLQYGATNGTITAQRIKLTKTGLDKVLEDVFISEEIGFEKPSINYYQAVFQKIGSKNPEEYLMIGDSLTSDMQGGNNAGMMTCWFNPKSKKNDRNVKIDFEIHDLKEIIDILI